MTFRIGASTHIDMVEQYWDRLHILTKLGVQHIEIYNKKTIQPLKKFQKERNCTLSIHSTAQHLFHAVPVLARAGEATLYEELYLAGEIRATGVVFHLPPEIQPNEEVIEKLQQFVDYAASRNTNLILENEKKGYSYDNRLNSILHSVTNLRLCIDLGHLNIAAKSKSVDESSRYLSSYSARLSELHINWNDGRSDDHATISDGGVSLLKKVIDGVKDLLLVVETRSYEEAEQTVNILKSLRDSETLDTAAVEKAG